MEMPVSLTVTYEVCDTIAIYYDLILCYNIGMESQIFKPIDIFGSEIYLSVVVLECAAICTCFRISLHQECSPYMLLLNNGWNQVSLFWHDIDNKISNSIHST